MKERNRHGSRALTVLTRAVILAVTACGPAGAAQTETSSQKYRGVLGTGNQKIKREAGKTFLWAGGGKPDSPEAQWYEFTGAPIPPEQLQFGIGKDRIRAIDDPFFVSPDDPRLLNLTASPYRKDKPPKTTNDIMVSGYADENEARAYPIGLLDFHELVNDTLGGKPITVGW